jgi:hypothetical protein
VASLEDPKAQADPATAELAAWSLVHGFSTLWLNGAVTADTAAQHPMAIVERMGLMLFDG